MTSTTSAFWNYADIWESIADRFPDSPAQSSRDRAYTWRAFNTRAESLARFLVEQGLERQDKVAQFMCNRPEYLESMFAAFKASLVPVNTNFRYTDRELNYIWTNCDARAVVFEGRLADKCDSVRTLLPDVRCWLWVDDGTCACPPWATPYEIAAREGRRTDDRRWERSGDDLFLLYTGGTTGKPKGVMWPQHDLFMMLESQTKRAEVAQLQNLRSWIDTISTRPRVLPAAPLMHGTAAWYCLSALANGGCVVTNENPSFDVEAVLSMLDRERIQGLAIVGDAFAVPLLERLRSEPGRWDLTSLRVILSSGVSLGPASKTALLSHAPQALVIDSLGTSESGTMATSRLSSAAASTSSAFSPTRSMAVLDEAGLPMGPSSGAGRLAVGGHIPIGYYKDPAKTASTFLNVNGQRMVVAGDWAEISDDGSIRLLGRGSSVINTGGEKVFPEEVEECLKALEGITDAAVIGLPNDRFGETVAALLVARSPIKIELIREYLQTALATYKLPRRYLYVESLQRSANGKLNHRLLRDIALSQLKSAGE